MSKKQRSLRFQLTRRLIVLQIVTLMLFVLLAAVSITRFIDGPLLDDRVIDEIARDISRGPDGLVLNFGRGLQRLKEDYPGFWFVATNEGDQSVSLGRFPQALTPMLPNLRYITSANISDTGDVERPMALVRHVRGEAGMLYVISGGGPSFEPLSFRQLFANRFFVGMVAVLTLAMIVFIPLIIDRELRGLRVTAREAEAIDVDKRGMRLSADNVPAEMHPLVRAINEALARLDEGFERRQRFLADAAHEMRTPIAIMGTRVQLMADGPDKQALLLDVARLSTLANQLLDLHRLDGEQFTAETIDLVELAAQVTGDLAPLAIAAGDEISFDSDARRVLIEGDHAALSRALTNLVQNAISYAGDGAQIDIFVGRDGRITVGDNGPGIPVAERSRVFDPFYRVVGGERGAGLGLNLVKDIVTRHHGRISVSDSPLGGALFTIELPLAAAVGQEKALS